MELYMDMHTHTFASGHGYSSLKENIDAARERGLKYLGLSEHSSSTPGGPGKFFFSNYRCIPREYGSLRLFCGVEVNILSYDGRLDMEESQLRNMDYVIASMHTATLAPGSAEENTRAAVQAMKSPYVKVLGHPDDSRYPMDYDRLVRAAREEQVALEVNNSSLDPQCPRTNVRENILTMLRACVKYGVPVLLGTDSHICYSVGHFERALEIIEEAGFPEELVLNANPDNIVKVVNNM